jgi:thioredoxin
MKRILSLLMLAAILSMGCNSQTPDAGKEKANNEVNKPLAMASVKPMNEPIKLDKQKFLDQIVDYESNPQEWIYKGELPGLIDFYADWCRPCRITSPILEELAQEYAGQINVYKIDVQAEQELAAVFGIQSIPSFLFIPVDDKPVMSSGIAATPEATKEMFRQQINEILLNQNTSN